jgi:hypothetical protein
MKYILGIDPGHMGGIALISKKGRGSKTFYTVVKTWEGGDDPNLLSSIVRMYKPGLVILEKQQAMSGQGVSSTFKIGNTYGLLEGVLIGSNTNYITVHSKTWMNFIYKTYAHIDILKELEESKLKATKIRNLSICSSLFSTPLRTPRGRWLDGLSDALLIALYGFLKEEKDGILLSK